MLSARENGEGKCFWRPGLEERALFEVKFSVRLPPGAGLKAGPSASPFPQEADQTHQIQQSVQGESSTHGNSSNPDASGDDHQTQ
jgi:hypothetical protein